MRLLKNLISSFYTPHAVQKPKNQSEEEIKEALYKAHLKRERKKVKRQITELGI